MGMYDKPLFVYEMANNHQGDVEHGRRIIQELKNVSKDYEEYFNFAFKFQYRDLDTFIHPDYKERFDVKNIKRFRDTKLVKEQFVELLSEVRKQGFFAICTPFDETSVDLIVEHNYDVIKIASCSFTDWPLLEKIASKNKPVIASAAGSSEADIDKVVNFFKHRHINFSLMHCVAEYPTMNSDLQMNQITYYQQRFKGVRIGFSTHERPNNLEPIKMAVAKGASIFEKHIGVETETIKLNDYSATPEQIRDWLKAAFTAYEMCGVIGQRYTSNQKELDDLAALQRGVFAKKAIKAGEKINMADLYLAFPCTKDQVLASNLSKYISLYLKAEKLEPNSPIMLEEVNMVDDTKKIRSIIIKIMEMLKKSNVVIPVNSTCEISHHYGLDGFEEVGVTMIDCINREYCKKILIVLPGQTHPIHMHKRKEETFTVLYGELEVQYEGNSSIVCQGESMVVERGTNHSFRSEKGCVFEEISTTHYIDDSFYDEWNNFVNPRKTKIYITKEMLDEI